MSPPALRSSSNCRRARLKRSRGNMPRSRAISLNCSKAFAGIEVNETLVKPSLSAIPSTRSVSINDTLPAVTALGKPINSLIVALHHDRAVDHEADRFADDLFQGRLDLQFPLDDPLTDRSGVVGSSAADVDLGSIVSAASQTAQHVQGRRTDRGDGQASVVIVHV